MNFGTASFTLEAWFNTQGANGRIADKYFSSAEQGYIVGVSANKLVAFLDSGSPILTGSATAGNNLWHHASMVRNGATVSLYLNGVSDGSVGGQGAKNAASNHALIIGAEKNVFGIEGFFKGFMDEVRVLNTAI